jgi:hypothetical protein
MAATNSANIARGPSQVMTQHCDDQTFLAYWLSHPNEPQNRYVRRRLARINKRFSPTRLKRLQKKTRRFLDTYMGVNGPVAIISEVHNDGVGSEEAVDLGPVVVNGIPLGNATFIPSRQEVVVSK